MLGSARSRVVRRGRRRRCGGGGSASSRRRDEAVSSAAVGHDTADVRRRQRRRTAPADSWHDTSPALGHRSLIPSTDSTARQSPAAAAISTHTRTHIATSSLGPDQSTSQAPRLDRFSRFCRAHMTVTKLAAYLYTCIALLLT